MIKHTIMSIIFMVYTLFRSSLVLLPHLFTKSGRAALSIIMMLALHSADIDTTTAKRFFRLYLFSVAMIYLLLVLLIGALLRWLI